MFGRKKYFEMLEVWKEKEEELLAKEGEHRWRRYCGLGNFNIDLASYCVKITSHNKKKCVRENIGSDGCEYGIPNRCPLLKEK